MPSTSCPNSYRRYVGLRGTYLEQAEVAMGELSPLVRQWVLLRLLSARHQGLTVKEIAQELHAGEKTVRRDLDAFCAAGFPLEETREKFGRKRWRIDPARAQPGLAFTFDEAIALYLGRRALDPLAGTLFWDAAQKAFLKIRAMLGPEAVKYVDRFAAVFHQTAVGASDYSGKGQLIDALLEAIEDHCIVWLTYQSARATEPVSTEVYPYAMAYHRGSLYLIGHSPDHGAIRHWKVDRIERVDAQTLRFNAPERFDLREHLAGSFGIWHGDGRVCVRVRFLPGAARYVKEHRWHPSQKLVSQPDGSLIAHFELTATEEIKRWVLGFGKEAEVLAPPSLRQEMMEEVSQMIRSYTTPHTGEPRPCQK